MRTQFKVDTTITIDVRPFGIFNRFIYDGSGDIYLENGMIDLGNMGFRNPEAYKPCWLYTNPDQCPINGSINLVNSNTAGEEISGCTKPAGVGKITYDVKFSQSFRNGVESQALGCTIKVAELEMSDPRGPGKDCYSYYQPSIPTVYPTIIPMAGAGMMIEIFLQTTEAYLAQRAASVSNTVCRERDASIANYKGEEAAYCSEDLIYRKYAAREFPGSLFTGKLRLYNQALQGGKLFEYKMSSSGFFNTYEISLRDGSNPGEAFRPKSIAPGELRNRTYELNSRVHVMHRDSQYNYYLVNSGSWSFTYLEPNSSGRKLRDYLREKGSLLSKSALMAYEAYLLSTCLPSRSAQTSPNVQFEIGGSPFQFDWHGNWNGDKMARVGIGSIQNHARSALQQVTIELDSVPMLEEELRRKKESLLQQKLVGVSSGNTWAYYTSASLQPRTGLEEGYDVADPDNYCVLGDIEEGAWFFLAKVGIDGNVSEEDSDAAALNNKQYGGYVMSKEFYETFSEYASINGEDSDYNEFTFRAGKVYSWDEFQGAYYYHNLDYTDPRKASTFQGDFEVPLYCWFDKDDKLKILNYYERGADNFDTVIENDPTTCDAGYSRRNHTESYSLSTYFHGFSVSPNGYSDKAYRGHRSVFDGQYTGTTSEFDNWEWMCPPVVIDCPNPELTDWKLEVNPGLGLTCKGWWWGDIGFSVSTSTTSSSSESNSGSSFFIVPKSDAECAVFGHMDTITSSTTRGFQATYGPFNLQMWWCIGQFPSKTVCQYFAADIDCGGWYYYAFNARRAYFNKWGLGGSWTYDYATGIAANRAVGSLTPLMGISDFTNGSWANYTLWKRGAECDTRLYGPNQSFGDLKYFDGVFTPSDNWIVQNPDYFKVLANDFSSEISTHYVGTAFLAGKGDLHTIETETRYKSKGEFGEYWKFADGPPDPRRDPYIYSHFNVRSGLQNNSLLYGSTAATGRMPKNFPYLKGHIFVGYA